MSEKTLVNLIKASDKAVKGRLQHVVAILTPDGRIQLNGSANMVKALNENAALHNQIKDAMLANVLGSEEEIGLVIFSRSFKPVVPHPEKE